MSRELPSMSRRRILYWACKLRNSGYHDSLESCVYVFSSLCRLWLQNNPGEYCVSLLFRRVDVTLIKVISAKRVEQIKAVSILEQLLSNLPWYIYFASNGRNRARKLISRTIYHQISFFCLFAELENNPCCIK